MAAADGPEEVPRTEFRKDDATWLVRQFGRYSQYLKGESTYEGGLLHFSRDSGSLVAARTPPTQVHTQTRRLLQLSNRQHEEYLQNMHQLYAAHARRMRHSTSGRPRKRKRGCEQGAESSSSSSSEGETAGDQGAPIGSVVESEVAERAGKSKERSVVPAVREAPTKTQRDEANPLLLAAYDLLTCTTGPANRSSAALPDSLLRFLNSQQQKQHRRTAGTHKPPLSDGVAEQSAMAKTSPECIIKHSGKSSELLDESYNGQETFDGSRSLEPGEAEFHPARQLQESVMNLPDQNQTTKERLLREQLRLLVVRWKCLLLSDWNILVAGCGSKSCLLREFAYLALNDGFCCILNAYQREFKLQQALQAIIQGVRNHLRSQSKYTAAASATVASAGGTNASCVRLVKELKSLLRQCSHPLYLVVLGLDSLALTDARRHLAALASCDKVRLICSVDHVQHALLVDAAELRDFRFVFETAHTRRDYRDEVLSRWGSMCGFVPRWLWTASRVHAAGTGGSAVNFAVVLRGLTTNHKRLLRSIAELQLGQLERNESPIVGLADLGTETSGVSLSLSKVKLKELLVEVTSHGAAVHARKNGQDAVAIRANKAQLHELLELLDKAGL